MKLLPRMLLVYLLALALPLQGVAAVVMKSCAAGQVHAGAAADDRGASADARGAAAGAAEAQPCHAEAESGTHSCSACAACCAATALPPAPLTVASSAPGDEPAPVAAASYRSPESAGLERPPRPMHA